MNSPVTLKKMKEGIQKTLALMTKKNSNEVKYVTAAVKKNIIKIWDELKSLDKYRLMLANKIAELGGGLIIMDYLHFLHDQGLEDDNNFQCYCDILDALWNTTDVSTELSVALVNNRLFKLLNDQLTSLKTQLITDDQVIHYSKYLGNRL